MIMILCGFSPSRTAPSSRISHSHSSNVWNRSPESLACRWSTHPANGWGGSSPVCVSHPRTPFWGFRISSLRSHWSACPKTPVTSWQSCRYWTFQSSQWLLPWWGNARHSWKMSCIRIPTNTSGHKHSHGPSLLLKDFNSIFSSIPKSFPTAHPDLSGISSSSAHWSQGEGKEFCSFRSVGNRYWTK